MKNALFFWNFVLFTFIILDIALIWNIFFNENHKYGFLLSFILVALAYPTYVNIKYHQILFILLFFLLLTYKYRKTGLGGAYLAVAIFIKPFAVILLFFFMIARNFKAIWTFILSSTIIAFITFLVYGIDPFVEYLVNNPTLREPEWLFIESTNQSALAELNRNFPDQKGPGQNLLLYDHRNIAMRNYLFNQKIP